MQFLVVLLLAAAALVGAQEENWGYGENNGPRTWGRSFSGCNGRSQSPVALNSALSPMYIGWLFEWRNEDVVPSSMVLTNTGHTVSLTGTWPANRKPSLIVEGNTYELDNVHWHWGLSENDGTEHTVDGFRGAMEMHMVFTRNTTTPDRTVVYAQLFEVSDSSDETPGLFEVASNLAAVKKSGSSESLRPFGVDTLVSYRTTRVFWYSGSLTTPPCTEPVRWLVAARTTGVTEEELDAFRGLENGEGGPLVRNTRPVQPLNGRLVSQVVAYF